MNILTAELESQSVEVRDQSHNEVMELHQSLYHGLRFPPVKIANRYLRNDLAIALELTSEVNGQASRYACLIGNVPTVKVGRKLQRPCRCNDEQASVFVDAVEIVNDIERRVERVFSVIGLKSLDHIRRSVKTELS